MKYLLLLLFTTTAFATDSEWKVIDEFKFFKIHKHIAEKHRLVPYKASGQFDTSLKVLLALLLDDKNREKWMPRLVKSKLILKSNDLEKITVNTFELPWPLDNRDFVFESKVRLIDNDNKKISLSFNSIKAHYPVSYDSVRGIIYSIQVDLQQISENKTYLSFILHLDYGGIIPSVICNFITETYLRDFFYGVKKALKNSEIDGDYLKNLTIFDSGQ